MYRLTHTAYFSTSQAVQAKAYHESVEGKGFAYVRSLRSRLA